MSPTNPSIGFIGLGVMGFPMVSNLVEKMPDSAFYIFDVSKDVMAKASSKSTAIHTCQNSREVTEKAVG
jgi:3-hydroxyisobutyrate dehydrogenase